MTDKPHPEAVTGAFIRDEQGRILLVKSHKWPGKWVVGGGHIDYGETIEDAIEREVLEEYGMQVDFVRIIKVIEMINPPEFKGKKHFIGFQCECFTSDPESITLDDRELHDYKWFTMKEAVQLKDIVPVTLETIQEMYNKENNAQAK